MKEVLLHNIENEYPYIIERIAKVVESEPWEIVLICKDGKILSYWFGDGLIRTVSKDGNLSDEDYVREFGIKLSHLMYRKGMTQTDLAKVLGVTQAMVSKYLTGKTPVTYCQMHKIARALELPIEALLLKF